MLDVMVSVFMGDNPDSWATQDAEDAMRECDVVDPMERANFKRGYVAGFLASIGIDRRTMKFTCDECHKRKSAGKRSANTESRVKDPKGKHV